jgi:hypothetical protein
MIRSLHRLRRENRPISAPFFLSFPTRTETYDVQQLKIGESMSNAWPPTQSVHIQGQPQLDICKGVFSEYFQRYSKVPQQQRPCQHCPSPHLDELRVCSAQRGMFCETQVVFRLECSWWHQSCLDSATVSVLCGIIHTVPTPPILWNPTSTLVGWHKYRYVWSTKYTIYIYIGMIYGHAS